MKKTQVRTIYTDHEQSDLRAFMVPLYISRINKVEDIDTGDTVTLCLQCKAIYGYLLGIGNNVGYNSIYPNIETIAEHLCISVRSITNKLNTLEKVGLIKRVKHRQKGKFDSTCYWVYRPNMVNRKRWYSQDGALLKGKQYQFDSKQFNKNVKDTKHTDRLLFGLLDNVSKSQHFHKVETR